MCYLAAVLYRGLHTIKIPEKRKGFILFACPVDKTINDNVFSKHLLRNIGRENVRITDVLHGIGEDVYYNRRRRLRPYFTSELLDDQPIYLSEVNIIRGMHLRENNEQFCKTLLGAYSE